MNDIEIFKKNYIMKLIDVTLRDGGHAVKFNWSLSLAQELYSLFRVKNSIRRIRLLKQTSKF